MRCPPTCMPADQPAVQQWNELTERWLQLWIRSEILLQIRVTLVGAAQENEHSPSGVLPPHDPPCVSRVRMSNVQATVLECQRTQTQRCAHLRACERALASIPGVHKRPGSKAARPMPIGATETLMYLPKDACSRFWREVEATRASKAQPRAACSRPFAAAAHTNPPCRGLRSPTRRRVPKMHCASNIPLIVASHCKSRLRPRESPLLGRPLSQPHVAARSNTGSPAR